MKHKLKQNIRRHRLTTQHRLPPFRSRRYIITQLRAARLNIEAFEGTPLEMAGGLLQWLIASTVHGENRIAFRAACILTGRNRGAGGRYSVARTRIKARANEGKLFGARKSS